MKVIIAGSRGLQGADTEQLLAQTCAEFEAQYGPITEVVSSAEPSGIDAAGERWAATQNLPVQHFPYLREHGKRGGPIRNSQMAAYAEGLLDRDHNAAINILKAGLRMAGHAKTVGETQETLVETEEDQPNGVASVAETRIPGL